MVAFVVSGCLAYAIEFPLQEVTCVGPRRCRQANTGNCSVLYHRKFLHRSQRWTGFLFAASRSNGDCGRGKRTRCLGLSPSYRRLFNGISMLQRIRHCHDLYQPGRKRLPLTRSHWLEWGYPYWYQRGRILVSRDRSDYPFLVGYAS